MRGGGYIVVNTQGDFMYRSILLGPCLFAAIATTLVVVLFSPQTKSAIAADVPNYKCDTFFCFANGITDVRNVVNCGGQCDFTDNYELF
jgi:hypothetical protein